MPKKSWFLVSALGLSLFVLLQTSTQASSGMKSHMRMIFSPLFTKTSTLHASDSDKAKGTSADVIETVKETTKAVFLTTLTPGHTASAKSPLQQNQQIVTPSIKQVLSTVEKREAPTKPLFSDPILFGVSLHMSSQQVEATLGIPDRQEPSLFGYEWWIYNKNPDHYVQVGILKGKVVDVFSNSPKAALTNQIRIGTSYDTLKKSYSLQERVTFSYEDTFVEIKNDRAQRPLQLVGDIPVLFYLDKHNQQKVTGIRLIDKLVLLQGGFYETKWTYTGEAPNFTPPTPDAKSQEEINRAMERQILDLTNVMRYRYQIPPLRWNEKAAITARNHSIDMQRNQYFDHISATTGLSPFDRLKKNGLSYRMAGENIAAGFPDAIEASQSWLNSLGHRKNVLEKQFEELGVGVFSDYFTENFVTLFTTK
ncbi:SCP-like extracellular family protein [Brevibacillus laterosporus GI-9]|uniref:CAP domain-containing protein n=1 Tax=Brevibacillus laterosporus TaxID=1465 RepID=UPI000240515C|nr:CAP-associated domain-containing protein [Brevibacillus laterosporus]CCF16184.1 SCP-like extracellular family protein [Brevibacillus laterosporus GI-9]